MFYLSVLQSKKEYGKCKTANMEQLTLRYKNILMRYDLGAVGSGAGLHVSTLSTVFIKFGSPPK
jgi:hypothetical protein